MILDQILNLYRLAFLIYKNTDVGISVGSLILSFNQINNKKISFSLSAFSPETLGTRRYAHSSSRIKTKELGSFAYLNTSNRVTITVNLIN